MATYAADMPKFLSAASLIVCSLVLALPSVAFAKDAKQPFTVQVMQGKVVRAKGGVFPVSRQQPFILRIQAPAKTALFVNITGHTAKKPTTVKESNIHDIGSGYALVSNGTEYLWFRIPEEMNARKTNQRKRWIGQGIEGFQALSGARWELGTYIYDDDMIFNVAAVPVDAKGKLMLSGKVTFSSVRVKLGAPSKEDDCHLLQNMYRSGGFEPPSCEELNQLP
jgi:hypothetical protein